MRLGLTLTALAISTVLSAPVSGYSHGHLARFGALRPRTISSISYLGTYSATDEVKMYRNVPANVTVTGKLVDFTTGVEVRKADGSATTAISLLIVARHGGDNSNIVIDVILGPNTPLGSYQILLHYAIEASGPDKFLIRVFDHGTINTLSIVEPPEATGTYFTGKTYTLRLVGDHVNNAALFIANTGIPGLTVVTATGTKTTTVTSTSTSKEIPIRFASGGSFSIHGTNFFDQGLLSPPPSNCTDQCYNGAGVVNFQVTAVPVVSSVSPTTPADGSTIAISGTSLTTSGFTSQVRGRPRYGSSSDKVTLGTTGSGGGLTIPARANMRQDSLVLEYRPLSSSSTVAPAFAFPLPHIAVQGGTPVLTQLDSFVVPTGGSRHVLVGGIRTIVGRFLAPYPVFAPLTLAISPTQINTSLTSSAQLASTSITTSAPSSPIIKFGQNDLIVQSSAYFPAAVSAGLTGADSVKFGMIIFTDTISKTLSVTTPFGTVAVPNVIAVPPPTIAFIRRKFQNGQTTVVNNGVLVKGDTYEIGGVALIIASSGAVVHSATIKLNGQAISPAQAPSAAPGSVLSFTVPSTAASGTLTLETRAGVVSRAVTVQDPPVPLSIVGFQASPNDVVGGLPVTATVAFNASIPTGSTGGTLVVTQSSANPNVLILPAPTVIGTNPIALQIRSRVTRTVVTSTVTVTNAEATGTSGSTANATLTIRPPSPTGVSFSAPSVVGGQPVTATVQMNVAATLADSILVTLATDDPTTLTIPASVSLNGSSAVIPLTTHIVPAARTVTLTATFGGQTRSATLTVAPPTVASVVANPTSTIAPSTVPVAITLTASLPSAQTATIACTGQGLSCPTSVSISGSTASFNVTASDVPTARTGTITVTLNGVSTSGSLDIQPLALKTITVSPAAVTGGVSSSFTLQLNRAAPSTLTFSFTSSDPTVAAAPASVTFATGDLTKLVTVPTISPQTASKTVTITATANRSTPLGTSTIAKAATLTVNP